MQNSTRYTQTVQEESGKFVAIVIYKITDKNVSHYNSLMNLDKNKVKEIREKLRQKRMVSKLSDNKATRVFPKVGFHKRKKCTKIFSRA